MAINFPTYMDIPPYGHGRGRAKSEYEKPTYSSLRGFYILNYCILILLISLIVIIGIILW